MRAPLLALLVAGASFAGCFGKGDDLAPAAEAPPPAPPTVNTTLPDGRGESLGNKETNRTEAGAGGVDHEHDYWQGREQVVVFEGRVLPALFPFFPEGPGSTPRGVAYVTPKNDSQVWEGTEKVTVLVQPGTVRGQANPSPAALTLQWRTAADAAWRDPVQVAYGTPIEIPVAPEETDMPHSTASLWNFRLLFDRPALAESVALTVTAHRGRDVADWPGHPDFYADAPERVVFDGDVTTHQYGFPENGFYEGMEAWKAPDKLVSYGTGVVDVYVNVTRFASRPPIPATQYVLYVHNATALGIGCCDGDVYREADGKNDLKTYRFTIPVDPAGMDSPYQPASRWGFHLAAVTGAFTDSTTYDIDYHMTIIARKAETAAPLAG